MSHQIEVVCENGVLRPLRPLPAQLREHQRLTVTIEEASGADRWLAGADPAVSLDAVRQALAKAPDTLARLVRAEREDRY